MPTAANIQAAFAAVGRVAPSDETAARMARYIREWGSLDRALNRNIGGVGSFFTTDGHEAAERPADRGGVGLYRVCDWMHDLQSIAVADQAKAA